MFCMTVYYVSMGLGKFSLLLAHVIALITIYQCLKVRELLASQIHLDTRLHASCLHSYLAHRQFERSIICSFHVWVAFFNMS
jgi:hypothetical protein